MRRRDVVIVLLSMAVAVAVAISVFSGSVLETGSWGLSFRQPGTTPIGNAGADQLKEYDAVYVGDPGVKKLYLTFDSLVFVSEFGKVENTLEIQRIISIYVNMEQRISEIRKYSAVEILVFFLGTLGCALLPKREHIIYGGLICLFIVGRIEIYLYRHKRAVFF